MSEFPTIRTVINQLKPLFPEGFRLRVSYSGSDDSGWFDGWDIVIPMPSANGVRYEYLNYDTPERKQVAEIIDPAMRAIEEELYKLLGSRFPGWEIGDGHVQGSHGYFDIDPSTNRISQRHIVDYNEEQDNSPDEKVPF